MSSTSPCAPAGKIYRAGTLTYTTRGLCSVFAWLLGGEVVFTLIDMIEPNLLPLILKQHGASDTAIGVIIGTFNAVLQLLIMPPLGYYSDRLRTRWGRRIPLLFLATPFVTLFLALAPFAPEIARALGGETGWFARWLEVFSIGSTLFLFALLVLLYRMFQTVTNVTFFGLLRDVVPDTHMGRFLALFRVFGAAGTFIINYWLLGHAETHAKPIFLGIAVLNLVGFSAICWFVREGSYPPVETIGRDADRAAGSGKLRHAIRTFVAESYRHPVYLWTYFVRICLYGALLGLMQFTVFFPQHELGMTQDAAGKAKSWAMIVWIVIAFPIGWLVDKRGAVTVLKWGLALITFGYVASYFLAVGPRSYLALAFVTLYGVPFWVVMLAQLKLTQEIFHPLRYSQLAGANTIVQSLVVATISPVAGWSLDALRGWSFTWSLPLFGEVVFGRYRLVNLMMAALYGGALYGVFMVQKHRDRLKGPDGYVAPL
ncbi:MAG: MFS transporter [Opitutaceae bacterium]